MPELQDYTASGWRPRFNPWIIALTVTLATFMDVLDTSIANVALRTSDFASRSVPSRRELQVPRLCSG